MSEYLHGAYGLIQTAGTKVANKAKNAFVYIGTAPVHLVAGGASNVNKPVLVSSIAEAKKKFGYSEDFASYTLCEAMKVHLSDKGVGPLVLINVLDPTKHKASATVTKTATPENGRVVLADAEKVYIDSVAVKSGSTEKKPGTDYELTYTQSKKTLTIAELSSGALGTAELTITYSEVDPSKVEDTDVIGATDGAGLNTGCYAVRNVYQETGYVPSFLLAPGFGGIKEVHNALLANSKKVNGHWDAYMLLDIPLVDKNAQAITLTTAATWKKTNGYVNDNETVYFPMAAGTDGKKYHLSVLAAANLQELLYAQDGIPYKTASNTAVEGIENLYLGENNTGRVYDDTLINDTLCKNGIASAAFVGGEWVIWGCHSASYEYSEDETLAVFETNRMMLNYLSNDFQARRSRSVDKPLTANDLKTIVAEEQTRLDALVKTGALIYGEAHIDAEGIEQSDVMRGDYAFTFDVTTTPLAKSLTATVNWTDEGFVTYFENFSA